MLIHLSVLIFESYYREALAHKEKRDTKRAGERMWGTVMILVKLYAAAKGVFISHCSLRKLYSFVENNVEAGLRNLFCRHVGQSLASHPLLRRSPRFCRI